jgi:xanthine dehydrogenase YagR molybdenum-binding subunit
MAEKITTTLNGQVRTFDAEIETSALELIREQAGLTGTKLVCGSGACGACTVLVDGEARCSCLMPALQMEGKSIETVEAHAAKFGLHPVQKAFLAHDGLQCGFCTPGFINEGIAFYTEWQRTHVFQRPSREQVAAAMAGHYCRCGAYEGIYAAMMDACEGKFDGPAMPAYLRNDGPAKVTGAAKYTADIQLPGQLVGAILRSTIPHGKIKRLDLGKAQAMAGVKAVLRLKADYHTHFEGEPLAAVAAETHALAHAALQAIEVEYEPLPFLLDIREAMRPGGLLLTPEDKKTIPVASEAPPFPGNWEGNVRKTLISLSSSNKGKANRRVGKSSPEDPTHFAATFTTPTQFHTCLEPHCAVADWQEGGRLTVYASTQGVYFLAKRIAEHYKLKEENVKVIAEHIGGAFGSKLTFHTAIKTAIDLSRAAKAPVAVIYSRAEEFTETGYRPSAEIEVSITADADGSNAAYTMNAYGNSGFAIGSNVADISGLGYTGISKSLQDYDVLTNYQPGAAFRAPGGPGACFALEQAIDQLAFQLKMDPITFRRKWEKHEGYLQLFDWVEKLPLWKKRKPQWFEKGRQNSGIGVAFGGWMHIYMPSVVVEVEASPAGITVRNAVQDMGQGARSVLSKAVADVFGIAASEIKVEAGHSTYTIGPTSGGSRTTASIYPAAFEAAEKLRDAITKEVGKKLALSNAKGELGGLRHATGKLAWPEAFQQITLIRENATRGHNDGFNPMGMVPLPEGMELGQNRSYGAYVIEVEVNDYGRTRVTQVHGAMRVGKVHVRPLAESQCQGGVIQGIGHVLYEDRAVCAKSGRVLSRGLEDYRIPGMGDIPPIHIDFIEDGFEMVKHKGIGLAELCTVPVAGGVANAIYNCTGYRPLVAPITPERMLAGLKSIQTGEEH